MRESPLFEHPKGQSPIGELRGPQGNRSRLCSWLVGGKQWEEAPSARQVRWALRIAHGLGPRPSWPRRRPDSPEPEPRPRLGTTAAPVPELEVRDPEAPERAVLDTAMRMAFGFWRRQRGFIPDQLLIRFIIDRRSGCREPCTVSFSQRSCQGFTEIMLAYRNHNC